MDNNEISSTKISKKYYVSSMKDEHYFKGHKVFREYCPQIESCLKFLSLHLPSAMQHLSTQDDVCKILSVGSGDGEVDLQVLQLLKHVSKKKVYNKVIDPNQYSLGKYKETVTENELPPGLTGDQAVFDIEKPITFQDYMVEKKSDAIKFDVVHFVHCMYYMDVEETLTHCYYNELGDKGLIICILAGDDFMLELEKMLFNFDQTSKTIIDIIKKYGWKYQHQLSECYVDVTEVFDEQSEKGNLLLDFLTQTANCRQTMSDQILQEIMEIIERCSNILGSKRMCKQVDDYIFILK